MFGSFKRRLPQVSIFHNPSSPPSIKALSLLRTSLTDPFPPSTPAAGPLEFDLEVVDSAPTPDQLRTILSYLPSPTTSSPHPALSSFLTSHPSSPSPTDPAAPSTPQALASLAQQNPKAFKWPVVVDWTGGRATVGDIDGVKGILEEIRKVRDGEVKEEGGHEPQGWFS
ncbi:hypothetical protein JAAARDRAFT_60622 [Jaapia argillacea MUCL 33604]|uniref:Thioredoxin-like fold domain-containing protein n=1 Tax=Jaapia argillacea MUCL 33604 TaxID=933084 RepID=A0A067PWE4_9AGAM|nr:hypothetical protein JAAARDRAFT_60622 [Jaapia argillacea MUCL 33604]